jgi:hypothetical protein
MMRGFTVRLKPERIGRRFKHLFISFFNSRKNFALTLLITAFYEIPFTYSAFVENINIQVLSSGGFKNAFRRMLSKRVEWKMRAAPSLFAG